MAFEVAVGVLDRILIERKGFVGAVIEVCSWWALMATDESRFRINFSLKHRHSGKCNLESDGGMVAENNREGDAAEFARHRSSWLVYGLTRSAR